jgi:hypothetical protein
MNKEFKLILGVLTIVNILLIYSYRNSIISLQNDLKRIEKEYLELNHIRQNEIDTLNVSFSNFKVDYYDKHPNSSLKELSYGIKK